MKQRYKLSIILLIFIATIFTLFATAGVEYTGTVDEARSILSSYNLDGTVEEKRSVLDLVNDYITEHPIDPSSLDYSEFMLEMDVLELDVANDYLDCLDASLGTAKNGAAVRRLSEFLKSHPIDENTEGFHVFNREHAKKLDLHNKAIKEAKEKLNYLSALSDYGKIPMYDMTFDRESDIGKLNPHLNVEGDTVISFIGNDKGRDGDNGYYTVKYEKPNYHFRTSASFSGVKKSVVFEFDFTTFGKLPNKLIWFSEAASAEGVTWSNVYISITPEGHIVRGNSASNIIIENAVVPGEWVHISLVINCETNILDVYVDYELMSSVSHLHSNYGYNYTPQQISIGANPSVAGGEFSIDNLRCYDGHVPRSENIYDGLTTGDKFVFCVDQLYNNDLPSLLKYDYYKKAESDLAKYWDGSTYQSDNEKIDDAIDRLLLFDDEKMLSEVSELNNIRLASFVNYLVKFGRNESNIAYRTYYLNKITDFIAIAYINKASDTYIKNYKIYSDARDAIVEEEKLVEFTKIIEDFYATSSIKTMQELVEKARSLMTDLDLSVLDNADSFPSFYDAYNKFFDLDTVIYDSISIENSKKIIACINYINEYDTEDEWLLNYDFMEPYVNIVREIYVGGIYDPFYNDAGNVLSKFIPTLEFFYNVQQEKHISKLKSDLQRCKDSDSYFERYGICIELRQYIDENEIATDNAKLNELVAELYEQLSILEEDIDSYRQMQKENAAKFVEICMKLTGSLSYAQMKPIFDEAAKYYYYVDFSNQAAKDALSIYNARRNEIYNIEAQASQFLASVAILVSDNSLTADNILIASQFIDKLELSCKGVDEAMLAYLEALETYDISVNTSNSEIDSSIYAMSGLMCNESNQSFITLIISKLTNR